MTTPTTTTVWLSRDGSNWTDVSAYVAREGYRIQRGRSSVLGEWQPGTFSTTALNRDRAIDPTNDGATFQLRPGDEIKFVTNGATRWRGRIDKASINYEKAGATPNSRLVLSGSDGLATLARATVSDLSTAVAGYGTYYTGALIDLVLALSNLDYANAATTDAGDVATSLPDTGTLNALQLIQTCTRTEGGNAQLFTLKDGTLRWRSRYARPSTIATFGGSGVPFSDVRFDYSSDEWSNLVNLNVAQHVDYQSSVTSVTTGTGTKNFTLDALPSSLADGFGFSAGAAVYIESDGAPSNNMTGTVTSFNESTRALVVSIASKNGTATRTDWTLTFTEPTSTQTATDAQSRSAFREYRTANLSTYHRNSTAAASEATILAAARAWPARRVSSITVEMARLSSGEKTTVLALEIGDAIDVSLALGTGSPSTLRQVRQIDGISEVIDGTGTHSITFTLGNEVLVDFTATLKQNGTVASTNNQAVYAINDGWCTAKWYVTSSATGTTNNAITVDTSGLPAPLDSSHLSMGKAEFYDLSGTLALVTSAGFDGTTISFSRHNTTSAIGVSPNFAVASGDISSGVIQYPIAQGSTFTVALAQSGARSSTLDSATYTSLNGRCRASFRLTATATGSAGNAITVTPTGLPTQSPSDEFAGTFVFVDSSTGTKYEGGARFFAGTLYFCAHNTSADVGASPSLALGSGDVLHVTLDYPIA